MTLTRPSHIRRGVLYFATAALICLPTGAMGQPKDPKPSKPGDTKVEFIDPQEAKAPPKAAPKKSFTEDEGRALAGQVQRIFASHCYQCHGAKMQVPGFRILDAETWSKFDGFVTPRNPEGSHVWFKIAIDKDSPMPPAGSQALTPEERDVIYNWILSGAAPLPRDGRHREPIPETAILGQILDDLAKVPAEDVATTRYISLVHLHNNITISDESLRLYRGALAKLVNSLSWKPRPIDITPVPFDSPPWAATIYRINYKDLDWQMPVLTAKLPKDFPQERKEKLPKKFDSRWKYLINEYRYGLRPTGPAGILEGQIRKKFGPFYDGFPFVRLDWFVTYASAPENYYVLLDLPETFAKLQERLRMDHTADLKRTLEAKPGDPRPVRRVGSAESGIALHNRAMDRVASDGPDYLYVTFDFSKSSGKANLYRFPLGPKRHEIPAADDFAFDHAGGEIIFRLPNGLHGYMLVNNQDEYICEGPLDVVFDRHAFSGSPKVRNGISCMGCHPQGLRPLTDVVRSGFGKAQARLFSMVSNLYADNKEIRDLLAADNKDYAAALARVCRPFELPGDKKSEARWFLTKDPVSAMVEWYFEDLTLEDAAGELPLIYQAPGGALVDDRKFLAAYINSNAESLRLGLGPLANGGTVKRVTWEAWEPRHDGGTVNPPTLFQSAAEALRLGEAVYPSN